MWVGGERGPQVGAVRAVGAVGAVGAVRAVGAGGAGGRAGAAIEHYFLLFWAVSTEGCGWGRWVYLGLWVVLRVAEGTVRPAASVVSEGGVGVWGVWVVGGERGE